MHIGLDDIVQLDGQGNIVRVSVKNSRCFHVRFKTKGKTPEKIIMDAQTIGRHFGLSRLRTQYYPPYPGIVCVAVPLEMPLETLMDIADQAKSAWKFKLEVVMRGRKSKRAQRPVAED